MAKGSFGERLKRERELREVTLEEITQGTRIGPRFLEALENEDWDKLPGGVFNRGFVRSIARYLGLDEEGFLAEYDLAFGPQTQAQIARSEERIPSPPKWIPVAVVLGALVVLTALVFAGIWGWKKYLRHPKTQESAPVAQAPDASPPAGIDPASSSNPTRAPDTSATPPLKLAVSVSTVTHVRIEADGSVMLDTDVKPGDNQQFTAKSQFVVTAADSSAVLLELNGEAMPPIGTPGASGTITLSSKNLRQGSSSGNAQP
jgi:cytoskeleton protein RodZ